MKITRKDIYMNDWAYAAHCRAETWNNAIWSVKHVIKHHGSNMGVEVLLRAFRANMRNDRKDAIRAAMRAKGGAK